VYRVLIPAHTIIVAYANDKLVIRRVFRTKDAIDTRDLRYEHFFTFYALLGKTRPKQLVCRASPVTLVSWSGIGNRDRDRRRTIAVSAYGAFALLDIANDIVRFDGVIAAPSNQQHDHQKQKPFHLSNL
jgi:hypothetical protein